MDFPSRSQPRVGFWLSLSCLRWFWLLDVSLVSLPDPLGCVAHIVGLALHLCYLYCVFWGACLRTGVIHPVACLSPGSVHALRAPLVHLGTFRCAERNWLILKGKSHLQEARDRNQNSDTLLLNWRNSVTRNTDSCSRLTLLSTAAITVVQVAKNPFLHATSTWCWRGRHLWLVTQQPLLPPPLPVCNRNPKFYWAWQSAKSQGRSHHFVSQS